MSVGNEILTLQFGHYSNYVGSHWLNLQEAAFSYNPNFLPEINNDILFREGKSISGELSYSPRLLAVDFKRSFGYLESCADQKSVDTPLFDGTYDRQLVDQTQHINYEKNEYLKDREAFQNNEIPVMKNAYDLNDSVHTWTDFIVPRLHERTLNIVNGFQFDVNDQDFNCFSQGTSLWKTWYFEEDFTDKIRLYLEECDNLQGFKLLIDSHNGFTGLSSSCLEYLKDEYDKKTIFSVPLFDPEFIKLSMDKKGLLFCHLNSTLLLSNLAENSNIITPLGTVSHLFKDAHGISKFQNLSYDNSRYHTSAVLAMALETLSTPYRLRDKPARMSEIIREVCTNGRLVCGVGCYLPFSMSKEDKLFKTLDSWDGKWFESLTPEVVLDPERFSSQVISTRGFSNSSLRNEIADSKSLNRDNPALLCKTAEEMFKLFFDFTFDNSKNLVSSCETTLRIPSTFPKIYNDEYNLTRDQSSDWGRVPELRTLSSIHNTTEVKTFLTSLVNPCKSKMVEKIASTFDIAQSDFSENVENIERLASCYSDSSWLL